MKVYIRKNGFQINSRLTRYAVQWYAHMLMHHNLCKNLEIRVTHKDLGRIYAEVMPVYEEDSYRTRIFSVVMNPLYSTRNYLLSLAHEMVHVKQYATGEVRDLERADLLLVKWKDVFVSEEVNNYYDLPWEIDAFGRELGLYVRLKDHIDKHKIPFDKPIMFDKRKVLDERRPIR